MKARVTTVLPPSSYKLHYEELVYKYESARNIKGSRNMTYMGVRRACINVVKYSLRRQDIQEQNNKTKNAVRSQFRKAIGMGFYIKAF